MQQDIKKIQKKIQSIGKINKITKAMKIISSIKVRQLKEKTKETTNILNYMNEMIQILEIMRKQKEIPSKTQAKALKTLWIIYFSEMGFCGPYNNQLMKEWKDNKKSSDFLVVIGQKGINYLQFEGQRINWKSLAIDFNLSKAKELANFILNDYPHKWNRVKIICAEIAQSHKMVTVCKNLLPVENKLFSDTQSVLAQFTVEPNLNIVYNDSVNIYLNVFLLHLFWKSRIAEEFSRRSAMEEASENADEMANNLKLKYNQMRQEKITREILTILRNDD